MNVIASTRALLTLFILSFASLSFAMTIKKVSYDSDLQEISVTISYRDGGHPLGDFGLKYGEAVGHETNKSIATLTHKRGTCGRNGQLIEQTIQFSVVNLPKPLFLTIRNSAQSSSKTVLLENKAKQ